MNKSAAAATLNPRATMSAKIPEIILHAVLLKVPIAVKIPL